MTTIARARLDAVGAGHQGTHDMLGAGISAENSAVRILPGAPAMISASGSESVAAADLTLTSSPVPNQPSLFFYAPIQAQIPFGHGFLCISGGIINLPVVFASGNSASFTLNFSSLPAGGQINPGDTWNFQHWYRDPVAGGAAFNSSDAVSIVFIP